ncbi:MULTISPECIES: C40 family peptidase [Actinomadura]|uniref:NlpC/P60 family protein n=1 Tax=Actinomadura litoris TaxID=2678616 RepID=A0A7K1L663_9ACTN|nr:MULTISPECIES: C40 family peptidase [Actinomadura]MBT2213928.1 C40 family peptidase [Actinomadura sp. NEAU-AAG7]MUN39912.1 NlpC/P60 family protein [Actinomadura litoris]
MRKPNRRVLPTLVGVSVLTTLSVNGAVLVVRDGDGGSPLRGDQRAQFVAASASLSSRAVAPLSKRLTPHVLVAAPSTLPAEVVDKVRAEKGVQGVEVVDAVQGMVAGKRVGLLGVEPSTFRNYTPKPTAQSDGLWRNVAAGDVAISFTMGNDGGVRLGSQVPAGGRQHPAQLRVGAYATMGISDVDAVVSHTTAQSLGMPTGNAMLISVPKGKPAAFIKRLKKVLPKDARAVEINPEIDYPKAGGDEDVPTARGQVMTASQVRTVIRAAYTRIGWPYVWGGESEAEGGYDCSGLMQYAFARAGIKLPRVAADQARAGWVIPYAKAQPGDMLIWANDPTAPGYISHIALYLGEGKMLAAPRTGLRVQVQDVYTRNMRGAVRVSPKTVAGLSG